jgi:HK97 family phage major capsid protein
MKTISQYKEDIKALMKKAADIDAKCVNENRDPVEAELTLKNEILDTVSEYQHIIKTMERQERMRESLENPEPRQTVQNSKDKLKGSGIEVRDKDKFNSLGEQLCAIINAGRPNGSVDPRLYNAASGLNETVPSEGGFLIQKDFTTKVYEDIFNNGLIAGKCQKIPISGPSNGTVVNGFDETSRASSTAGGVVIYWADEAGEKTASKPQFRRVELNLKKMIGLCYLTDEMIMDAATIQATVSNAFKLAMDFTLQNSIINGTGAGQPLGILNSGCLVSVGAEAGQGAATILTENIVKMYARRFAALTGNYAFYYNQDIEPQLFTMSLSVGTGGGPVYMPPGGLSQAPYGTIMGRPAYAIEQCPTLGTQGDIILANFQDGYLLAEKGSMQSDMSIHVRFVWDETALRFVLRVDGQPWRASALTPAQGSNTQSHFITLDSR